MPRTAWFSIDLKQVLTVLAVLLFVGFAAIAQTTSQSISIPSLFASSQTLPLAEPVSLLVAPSKPELQPTELGDDALKAQFAPWQQGNALPTQDGKHVWMRIVLPATAEPQSWMLRVPRLTLSKATLWSTPTQGTGTWTSQSAGVSLPNSTWPLRTRDPVFELTTSQSGSRLVYLQLEHRTPVTEGIQLIRLKDFSDGANYAGALTGTIMGVFGVFFILSLLSAWVSRSNHFVWFALFAFSVMLTQLTLSGFMILRVWTNSVFLAQTMGWVLPLLSLATLARFAMSVSYAKEISKPIYFGLWAMIGICALMAIAVMLSPNQYPLAVLNVFFVSGMLFVMGAMSWIAWRSQTWLWVIVGSMIPIVLSAAGRIAYNFGWVAHAEVAMFLGVVTACIGLAVIYSALVNHLRFSSSGHLQQQQLQVRDPATGLYNERIARARLPQVLVRAKRFSKPCGVMLVRWTDFAEVMKHSSSTHRGRIFSHLGTRLGRLARDIDTVARFGDDCFIFIVEAPTTREHMNSLAVHILSSCLRPSTEMLNNAGFSLHIAVWLSSEVIADSDQALEMLKTRINQMHEGTQRRVQFVDTPLSTGSAGGKQEKMQQLIEKINSIEATQVLPTISTSSRTIDSMPSFASSKDRR